MSDDIITILQDIISSSPVKTCEHYTTLFIAKSINPPSFLQQSVTDEHQKYNDNIDELKIIISSLHDAEILAITYHILYNNLKEIKYVENAVINYIKTAENLLAEHWTIPIKRYENALTLSKDNPQLLKLCIENITLTIDNTKINNRSRLRLIQLLTKYNQYHDKYTQIIKHIVAQNINSSDILYYAIFIADHINQKNANAITRHIEHEMTSALIHDINNTGLSFSTVASIPANSSQALLKKIPRDHPLHNVITSEHRPITKFLVQKVAQHSACHNFAQALEVFTISYRMPSETEISLQELALIKASPEKKSAPYNTASHIMTSRRIFFARQFCMPIFCNIQNNCTISSGDLESLVNISYCKAPKTLKQEIITTVEQIFNNDYINAAIKFTDILDKMLIHQLIHNKSRIAALIKSAIYRKYDISWLLYTGEDELSTILSMNLIYDLRDLLICNPVQDALLQNNPNKDDSISLGAYISYLLIYILYNTRSYN